MAGHEENRMSLSSVAGTENLKRPPRDDKNHKKTENMELKKMLLNAQIENERLQEELNAVTTSEERLRAALAKAEADLEGLSKAYAALDAHAEELRVKLDASESTNQDHSATIASGPTNSKDDETALEDLLVCLALEEAKVAKLERELALLKGTHV